MKTLCTMLAGAALSFAAFADIQIINGVKYECVDGLCTIVEENGPGDDDPLASLKAAAEAALAAKDEPSGPDRLAQGYMNAADFNAFLKGEDKPGPLAGRAWWIVVILAFLGGLSMNLTPCVLPMVPINLMVIGKSALRGALYGLGIALAYGTLGLLASIGGMAFGEIQSSPWFNASVAVLFAVLSLALFDVFMIDLSKGRGAVAAKRQTMLPGLFAFVMGAVSAVLAGACVAPILISVLLLTADLSAQGHNAALALPFILGLGMALPWPFAGAGMQIMPKPGSWMKYVNRAFGVAVLAFAAWYGYLAYKGFTGKAAQNAGDDSHALTATPATFGEVLAEAKRPVLVDCWATWCKNCTAMERTVFTDPDVKETLENFTVIKLQAEDIRELRKLDGYSEVKGLPAFAIYSAPKAD